MRERITEERSFREFASRHGFTAAPGGGLSIQGTLDGVALSISKVNRGQSRNSWLVTRFLAAAQAEIPADLVAYKPNFRWRFSGPRRISDSLGSGGLFGFVHHDPVGDPELDRKLVIYANDVPLARALLTTPSVKAAVLAALAAAGHIRIHESQVAVELSERRRGVLQLISTADEVEAFARTATDVVRALVAACRLSRY
ncbi:MAG: hypothetical protein RBU30_22945 [Polyangia bacterium]|jgi:hypothetical protein|nr:hypothetical protein [Polyangia bacterium]